MFPPQRTILDTFPMSPSNSILRPRNIFTPAQANLEDDERRDHMEEELLKDDGLENISENEIPDEPCNLDIEEPTAQSFLGLGQAKQSRS